MGIFAIQTPTSGYFNVIGSVYISGITRLLWSRVRKPLWNPLVCFLAVTDMDRGVDTIFSGKIGVNWISTLGYSTVINARIVSLPFAGRVKENNPLTNLTGSICFISLRLLSRPKSSPLWSSSSSYFDLAFFGSNTLTSYRELACGEVRSAMRYLDNKTLR